MDRMSMRWLIVPATLALLVAVRLAEPGLELAAEAGIVDGVDPEVAARTEELNAAQALVNQRIELKEQLIAQLIEGRLSLEAVAAEFLRINQESWPCLRAVRDNFPGATDEEKSARNVIYYALGRARSPVHKKELQVRLEREFQQLPGTHSAP
jgi:hypothetical protein